MNATAYILRSLERGPSTRRGLLNELPPMPNANVRFHRALKSLQRKGAIHRVHFPEGYALGSARGCPCREDCCDDPDPVPLDLYLRDSGAEPDDIEAEYQWWWYCRHCKSRCNCEV